MNFHISKKSKISNARLGFIETSHGVIETPCLVPVATQAVVKTLTSQEVEQTGSQVLISNTFWLHLRPGEKVVEKAGGLHKFMNWKKPLMTDSGGFQVFSLGFGKDFNTGKVLKSTRNNAEINAELRGNKKYLIMCPKKENSRRLFLKRSLNNSIFQQNFQTPQEKTLLFYRKSLILQSSLKSPSFSFRNYPSAD